jgi:aerobic carbon-monoxide dehydrogenase small subunit
MPLTTEIHLTLNGVKHNAVVRAGMSTLEMLRDVLGLTGTKYGCGEGECGACTIIVDGRSVNSCLLFAVDCDGRELTTIEGLNTGRVADAVRQSFVAHGAVQCGFCSPGMVTQATALLSSCARPDAEAAKRAIEGNLCRCTGYQKIVDAIVDAGDKLAQEKAA